MPKYSFIVPVYNCGKYLVPCVESLLAQTVKNYEILLVDDGTPDDGDTRCDEFAKSHPCIRAFHKENGGAASARNYGIDRAQGEYLLFIDGDDTIEPDTLARIEAALSEYPADLVIFGMSFDYYDKPDSLARVEHLSVKHHGMYSKAFFNENFKALFADNALSSACNKVFSAHMLREKELRFRTGMTLYEDLEFVLRYFALVEHFYCIDSTIYHYRIDAASFSHKRAHQLRKLQDNLNFLAETMLDQEPVPASAADLMAKLYMELLVRHLLVTKYKKRELEAVFRYCEDSGLCRALEMGASMSGQEAMLWDMIRSRDENRLLFWLTGKRAKITLRKSVKNALKILGLRH